MDHSTLNSKTSSSPTTSSVKRNFIAGVGACLPPHRIAIVGEAPGREEDVQGFPFVGASGMELTKMLAEAGINREDCYITNVIKYRPIGNDIEEFITSNKKLAQQKGFSLFRHKYVSSVAFDAINYLHDELTNVGPSVILALGETALWATTGLSGITKWRGSCLEYLHSPSITVIPTYHPAAILRQWEWRWIAVNDMRKATFSPESRQVPVIEASRLNPIPVLAALKQWLHEQNERQDIILDIETKFSTIACIGIWAPSFSNEKTVIPFIAPNNPDSALMWSESEELNIILDLKEILTHPNAYVIGQNLIYDCQYLARFLGFIPNVGFDTMLAHHVAFSGLPKGLDFLSSMYLPNHRYWKDEGKEWNFKDNTINDLLDYNAKDLYATNAVVKPIRESISRAGLDEVFNFQMRLFRPVLKMMLRGFRIDDHLRQTFATSLLEELAKREQFIVDVIGRPLNCRSPKQLQDFFYKEMGVPPVISRKTGNPTTDDDALKRIASRQPLLAPITEAISDIRTLNIYYSTFVQAQTDVFDRRLRCSYNIAGTTTYRFSSSEDAFGNGLNLQTIPPEDKERDKKEAKGKYVLPNIRRLFIPDDGYIIFDWDLDRADLQVVVWEADDADLKQKLREGVDLHVANASDLYNVPFNRVQPQQRQMAKIFVHGTNYGGSARTMAIHCGITVHESESMQKRWFSAHPGIKNWHNQVAQRLYTSRYVTNRFGYRRFFFDRIDSILPEALAWIPQSTVACVINRGLVNVDELFPTVQLLLQVHDSLVMQIPYDSNLPFIATNIRNSLQIPIPYPDPLIIPVNAKASTKSWGDCQKWDNFI